MNTDKTFPPKDEAQDDEVSKHSPGSMRLSVERVSDEEGEPTALLPLAPSQTRKVIAPDEAHTKPQRLDVEALMATSEQDAQETGKMSLKTELELRKALIEVPVVPGRSEHETVLAPQGMKAPDLEFLQALDPKLQAHAASEATALPDKASKDLTRQAHPTQDSSPSSPLEWRNILIIVLFGGVLVLLWLLLTR